MEKSSINGVELLDRDGNLLCEYTYSSTKVSQHHDIFPLPNGNVLMLAVNTMTEAEAIQAGRDPNNIVHGKLFNEQILELEPVGANDANIVLGMECKRSSYSRP